MANLKHIVQAWLQVHRYDGLLNQHVGCACNFEDFMPCGEPMPDDCIPGHQTACDCDQNCSFHISEYDPKKDEPHSRIGRHTKDQSPGIDPFPEPNTTVRELPNGEKLVGIKVIRNIPQEQPKFPEGWGKSPLEGILPLSTADGRQVLLVPTRDEKVIAQEDAAFQRKIEEFVQSPDFPLKPHTPETIPFYTLAGISPNPHSITRASSGITAFCGDCPHEECKEGTDECPANQKK